MSSPSGRASSDQPAEHADETASTISLDVGNSHLLIIRQPRYSQALPIPGKIFWSTKWGYVLEIGNAERRIDLPQACHRFKTQKKARSSKWRSCPRSGIDEASCETLIRHADWRSSLRGQRLSLQRQRRAAAIDNPVTGHGYVGCTITHSPLSSAERGLVRYRVNVR